MSIIQRLFGTSYYGKKSFTYFLPAPPERNTGYQEKEFDQIFSYLNKMGYEVLQITTQSIAYGEHNHCAGIWIVCVLGLTRPELVDKEVNIDYMEISQNTNSDIQMDPDIIHD
tara:strand:+ start:101261 stop:101599 length:339 start_codon:yes stop_codon:yes gene_type:complete